MTDNPTLAPADAPAATPTPAPAPTPAPRRASTFWPMALVLITLILVVGIPIGIVAIRAITAPERMLNRMSLAAADMLRPKLTMNEIVLSSVSDLRKENKLVVMTAEINTDVTMEEGATSWGMYWGTNVARVAIRDAKVQYVIDTGKMETSDFIYNDQAKVLSVTLPRPHVDPTMVSIDPGKVQTLDLRGGWARFDKQETKDHALAELRPKVITQAGAPHVRELADIRGIEAATKLLQPLADSIAKDGVTLRITYRDDSVARE